MARKGVVVEFDFAALDGARLLFETTRSLLRELDGIALDVVTEAKYLSGRDCQAGLASLFSVVRTKKTALKAARDLTEAFAAVVTREAASALTVAFKNFVKALTDRGVKVVLVTRADIEAVRPAFEAALGKNVVLFQEISAVYGAARASTWRRACREGGVSYLSSLAVTGSGAGVRSALVAGMGSMGVVHDHVAYQDFGGADAVVSELSGPTAKKALEILRI